MSVLAGEPQCLSHVTGVLFHVNYCCRFIILYMIFSYSRLPNIYRHSVLIQAYYPLRFSTSMSREIFFDLYARNNEWQRWASGANANHVNNRLVLNWLQLNIREWFLSRETRTINDNNNRDETYGSWIYIYIYTYLYVWVIYIRDGVCVVWSISKATILFHACDTFH